ncbi:hypothetical protein AHML_06940 [Aeromonas hydrophila ML09-119]|nr:hypothetical protein AHML_06940 [Aeromonas hydrophila ML09-119]
MPIAKFTKLLCQLLVGFSLNIELLIVSINSGPNVIIEPFLIYFFGSFAKTGLFFITIEGFQIFAINC